MSVSNPLSAAETPAVPSEAGPVRNRIGWRQRLARLQGSPVEFDLQPYDAAVSEIGRLENEVARLPDRDLESRARRLRQEVDTPAMRERSRSLMYALVREASRRALGLRPFDVQLIAALALDRGAIVEMQTGEGKTLAAVMPVALNALSGKGVHVLTFNDYLARRDADWMGPVYGMLGLSVGFVEHGMTPAERRRAYLADVTYVTAKEAGFDHLRDLLAIDPADLVHRPFHFALVDEADSLLIDEARVPLVIAGSVGRDTSSAQRLAALVASFDAGVDFDADEYGRDVELTETGVARAEEILACGSLHEEKNLTLLTELNCALHARVLLRRDVEYLVRNGRIELVDELTGRAVADRHWPDGLQAALEAKEGLERQPDGRILGSMTLQHFLRGYSRLCGMTGTAQPAAAEIREFYGLRVVVVPTHRPMIRVDHPDVVFTHREAKERAVVDEIRRVNASGRPVLVGTLTVEESERLAERLRATGVACQVLNARNDAAEARVIAAAGAIGAVTISTNMAGRGTDIRLGGDDESGREQVVALGGLYVIGTNRHESRRVDLQLRGRAGRQGDPGESRFFISLEDDLLVRYGIRDLLGGRGVRGWGGRGIAGSGGSGIGEPFDSERHSAAVDDLVVLSEVARAQRIVEGQNHEIRRTLFRYSSVVEEQRLHIMERRQAILLGHAEPDVWQSAPDRRAALVVAAGESAVRRAEQAVTLFQIDKAWRDHLSLIAELREGIHLVALGGHEPLARFTADVVAAFHRMDDAIDDAVLDALQHVQPGPNGLDLKEVPMKGPSSTWTYLVNDDPFRNQIGMLLTGPGRTTIAMYSAAITMPLLLLWGLIDRHVRRRPSRRADLFRD